MKAFIYTGGEVRLDLIEVSPEKEDLIIAADSGFQLTKQLHLIPRFLVGDFDSLGEPTDVPPETEIIRFDSHKDATDTQLAVDLALKTNCTELYIIGGLTGRLDHTLSNLAILEYLADRKDAKHHAVIDSGTNRVRLLRSDSLLLAKSHYTYFGLLPLDAKVRGVEILGAKYPLKNQTLYRHYAFAVSNEIEGNVAFISVKKGSLLVVESGERL